MNTSISSTSSKSTFLNAPEACPVKKPPGSRAAWLRTFARS